MRIETPRQRARRRAVAAPFPAEWRSVLDNRMAHWRWLNSDEKANLEERIKIFIAEKRFEWVQGLERTDEIVVLVAASACLLILGLDNAYYRDVTSIIMYPSGVMVRGRRGAPEAQGLETDRIVPIIGQAALHGPMLIAWDSAKRAAADPNNGHNVVYHEFAHKIDMVDGAADGMPPMDADARERWEEVCDREYSMLHAGTSEQPLFNAYAGVNRAEFFAVATEFFFDRPIDMAAGKPDLYRVLREFYRQDPAARERRYLQRDDV